DALLEAPPCPPAYVRSSEQPPSTSEAATSQRDIPGMIRWVGAPGSSDRLALAPGGATMSRLRRDPPDPARFLPTDMRFHFPRTAGALVLLALVCCPRAGAPYPAPQDDADATARPGGPWRARSVRRVRFAIVPAGGRLNLDGRDVSWFGATFALSP